MTGTRDPGSGIRFVAARRVLDQAIAERAFPAAVIEVGTAGHILWRQAFGTLTFDIDAAPASDDTIFDLASLTKVVATTTSVMILVEEGKIRLADRVSSFIREARNRPRVSGTDLVATVVV